MGILLEIVAVDETWGTERTQRRARPRASPQGAPSGPLLVYVDTLLGGGVAGSRKRCSSGAQPARGARRYARMGGAPTNAAGKTPGSHATPVATRLSPHGTPSTRGPGECCSSTSVLLHTGHDAWLPPLAHVHTCAFASVSASTRPGSPEPQARTATSSRSSGISARSRFIMRGARILGPVPGPGKSEDAFRRGRSRADRSMPAMPSPAWKPGLVGDVLLSEARLALCREVDRR
jgi:hypothetical protein